MASERQEVVSSDLTTSGIPPPTDQQKELAIQAMQEFEKGQFTPCVNTMTKLGNQRGNDPKVLHNKAVASFYQSGACAVEDLKAALQTVCQMVSLTTYDPSDGVEDVDNAVLYYNQAVLNYHMRQYRAALHILEKGFHYIEPPDELLAQNVLLLWVELYLCVCQPEKALNMLAYLEKSLNSGKEAKTCERGDKGEQNKDAGKESTNTESSEMLRARLCLYKTRCLAMKKSMKSCKREIKTLVNTPGLAAGPTVQYLRAYFEYLRSSFRKAQKMLTSLPSTASCSPGESLPVMYYNNLGCIHYHLHKHHTGALYFRRAMMENEKIVKEVKSSQKGKPLHTLGVSRYYELMYNMGLQLLHCGKSSAAFDCLIQAVQVYQVNPRLWLRLAECCIMHNRENNDDDAKLEKRLRVIEGSVGSGIHRKIILGPGTGQDKALTSTNPPALPSLQLEFAALCLRNAVLLLPDDPLDSETSSTDDSSDGNKPNPEPVLVPAPPANPMRMVEVANLRCSILAASAYVALCLNDPLLALQHAENLLRQPRLSGAQRYVGNMYMAEALVALDRVADAISHLSPDTLTTADIITVPPEVKADPEKIDKNDKGEKEVMENLEDKVRMFHTAAPYPWIPRDLQKAKALMQHNLAVAHAVRGEYDKANKYLSEGSTNNGAPLPAQMYYLKLYLDLMEGRRQMAQSVIKEHFGHVTPNR
ncbi:LOW QUALITY PROTEIN: CCR4-NOT transcription complex subunit 10-like [Pomacea canaliculata]|uniref:LOW QUALITY PROTEIN: CCR4-NOT transcription complex subunit 10-like n=1 Tax=Pomacea canaliculata TaxID=400727 RepID=UPI000D72D828|nr:LOW QUALITY PROTEIN: CCR4-NOT transcription complex subunit 10-like [Pomacea canaliculata]